MGKYLQKRLLTEKFDSVAHETILNVWVTAAHLRAQFDEVFDDADLTLTQYNVLRILNGSYPDGYCRADLTRRMLDRAPDLTRLIDRLVKRGLVERARSGEDARQAITTITPKGRALVGKVNSRVAAVHKHVGEILSEKDARELSRLCEKLYGFADAQGGEDTE